MGVDEYAAGSDGGGETTDRGSDDRGAAGGGHVDAVVQADVMEDDEDSDNTKDRVGSTITPYYSRNTIH